MTRRRRRRLDFEHKILWLAVLAGLPGALCTAILLWKGGYSARVNWTVGGLLAVVWISFAAAVEGTVVRPLRTVSNLLAALRERRADVPLLGQHFLRQHTQRYRKQLTGFEPAALEALLAHPWPGNVRELDHAVERAVLMATGSQVRARDLGLNLPTTDARSLDDMSLEEVEQLLIRKALARHDGNVSRAAEALGLSRSALYRRLQRHGL